MTAIFHRLIFYMANEYQIPSSMVSSIHSTGQHTLALTFIHCVPLVTIVRYATIESNTNLIWEIEFKIFIIN